TSPLCGWIDQTRICPSSEPLFGVRQLVAALSSGPESSGPGAIFSLRPQPRIQTGHRVRQPQECIISNQAFISRTTRVCRDVQLIDGYMAARVLLSKRDIQPGSFQ